MIVLSQWLASRRQSGSLRKLVRAVSCWSDEDLSRRPEKKKKEEEAQDSFFEAVFRCFPLGCAVGYKQMLFIHLQDKWVGFLTCLDSWKSKEKVYHQGEYCLWVQNQEDSKITLWPIFYILISWNFHAILKDQLKSSPGKGVIPDFCRCS